MKIQIEHADATFLTAPREEQIQQGALIALSKGWLLSGGDLVIESTSAQDSVVSVQGPKCNVAFSFRTKDSEEALLSISAKDALTFDSQIINLIPPPLKFENHQVSVDQSYYDAQDQALSDHWDEELMEKVASFENALKVALGLALSGYGQTDFSRLTEPCLDEVENREMYIEHFAYVLAVRGDENGSSETLPMYVDLRMEERDKGATAMSASLAVG